MKIDITKQSDEEIDIMMKKFISSGYEQIDNAALERKIKFDGEKKKYF